MPLKIAVVGAGVSGLCAAKYAQQDGHSVTVFEGTSQIGGTWVYTEDVGVDEYGLPIHTSMYDDLRSNLPKEVMDFPDFPMLPHPESYVRREVYLSYLNSYVETFDLMKLIKLRSYVIHIEPTDGSKWLIYVKDLKADKIFADVFDAVFVCNGHNSKSYVPKVEGSSLFRGNQIHSHNFRKAEQFKDKSVLVVGAGPSGIDLIYLISKVTSKACISYYKPSPLAVPSNVQRKGAIKNFTESEVVFSDGSKEEFTDVIWCTGYDFSLPFLSIDCGITNDDQYISPLWKQCINVEYPTMAFIAYPHKVPVVRMIDLQVRFVMHYLNGKGVLPSKDEMRADIGERMGKLFAAGVPKRRAHWVAGELGREYLNDVAATAKIEPIPEVIIDVHLDCGTQRKCSWSTYRSDVYKIIDGEHFERSTLATNTHI